MLEQLNVTKNVSVSKEIRKPSGQRPSRSTVFKVVATILFAMALYPVRANAQGTAPTDPQIAGIVLTADQIDIDYAKLAMSKAKDQRVKDFAQQMITDHSSVSKTVGGLAAKLKVTPEDSETSNSLKAQAQETTQALRGLEGEEFERAYIDNEVAYHQAVIDATKTVLIPSAQNPELKSALQGATPLFEGHLQHAQRVQSAIESRGSNTASGKPNY